MSRQPARPARILALACIAVLALGPAGAMVARAVSPPPVSLTPAAVVDVPVRKLRATPRLSAPVLRRLPRGSVLRALFYRVRWLAVAAPDGTRGYVDRDDVRPLVAAPMAVAHAVTPTHIASGHARARPAAVSDRGDGGGQPTSRARRVRADPRGRAAAHAARARGGARDLGARRHARRARRVGRALPDTTGLAARAPSRETRCAGRGGPPGPASGATHK